MPSRHRTSVAAWTLVRTVHATSVEGSVVFLDTASNRYLCLPRRAADLEIAGDGATLHVGDPALADQLHAAGLVQRPLPDLAAPARRRAARPTGSALQRDYPAPRCGDGLEALGALLDVYAGYRNRPLAEIIARSGAPRRGPPREPLRETLDRFQRWAPFAPVSAKCLLRAFILRRLLHRQGHAHDWVFGVTLWPFKAHCWLQSDGLVLNDTLEAVSAYRPILVV